LLNVLAKQILLRSHIGHFASLKFYLSSKHFLLLRKDDQTFTKWGVLAGISCLCSNLCRKRCL